MVGNKIKTIRKANGYTQKEFAQKFNVAYATLQKYEYGVNEPKISFLENLCKEFKIPMSYFYEDTSKSITTKGDNNISFIGDKNVANLQNFSGANVKNSNFTNANGKDFANLPPILSEFIELYQTYANPQIEKMLQEIITKLRKIKELF